MTISPTHSTTAQKMRPLSPNQPAEGPGPDKDSYSASDRGEDNALWERYSRGLSHGAIGAIPLVGTAWNLAAPSSNKTAKDPHFGKAASHTVAALNFAGTSALVIGTLCNISEVVAGGVGLLMASGVTGAVGGALLGPSNPM